MNKRQWETKIRQARSLIPKYHEVRFKVAQIAIEATEHEHGKRRGRAESIYTLANFARAIDLNDKTLREWVRVKLLVVNKLPVKTQDKINKVKYDVLQRVVCRVGPDTPEKQVRIYFREESGANPQSLKLYKYHKHMMSVLHNASNPVLLQDVDEDLILKLANTAQLIANLFRKELEFRKKFGKPSVLQRPIQDSVTRAIEHIKGS